MPNDKFSQATKETFKRQRQGLGQTDAQTEQCIIKVVVVVATGGGNHAWSIKTATTRLLCQLNSSSAVGTTTTATRTTKHFRCRQRNARFAFVTPKRLPQLNKLHAHLQPSASLSLSLFRLLIVCCGRARLTFVPAAYRAAKSATFKSQSGPIRGAGATAPAGVAS